MRLFKRNVLLLMVTVLVAVSCTFAACSANAVGHIDVPAELQAELGAYISPDYNVLDDNGVVLYGYNVRLKSVTAPNGEELTVRNDSVTVSEKGVYTFVYTADSKKVPDATVKIDFADRTPPAVKYDSSLLPSFFIKGNSYSMPDYTITGDPDFGKCKAEVFHIANDENKTETQVSVSGNRFKVEHDGQYAIRIHVEDAVGNPADYEYVRDVDGPSALKENTVLYFGEEFGARQMRVREPRKYTGSYVSRADAEKKNIPAREDAADTGYYAVEFDGVTETTHNEGYAILNVPAVVDVRTYSELSLWVYYDGDNKFPSSYNDDGTVKSTEDKVVVGSTWWNDTVVPNKTWTKVTWSVNNWGYNVNEKEKKVGVSDISGMQLRMVFDWKEKTVPSGTFYFTEMVGTPKTPSTLTPADENVQIGGSKHYVGDSVRLSAAEQANRVVSHYTVDGTPLPGDTFVPTKPAHTVGVVYVDSELTAQNMTWGEWFDYPAGQEQWRKEENGLSVRFADKSDYWAVSLDVTGGYKESFEGNCKFNLSFAVGDLHTVEIYVGNDFNGCKWYYKGGSSWGEQLATFNSEQIDLFKNASAQNPVRVMAIRCGRDLRIFVNDVPIGRTSLDGFSYTDEYGYGYRNDAFKTQPNQTPVTVANAKSISGKAKVDLLLAQYVSSIEVIDNTVTVSGNTVYFGDEVRLTPAAAPEGKIFAYYELDGVRKPGNWNSFMATKPTHTIEAVFVDAVTLTLQDDVYVNGNTGEVKVPMGETVTLTYMGNPDAGRFFDCFTVNNAPVNGNSFTPTQNAYTVGVKTASNADDMTWGVDTDSHVTNYSYVNSYTYTGTHAGAADHWAIEATVKYPTPLGDAWYIFDFVVGSDRFVQVRVHHTGLVEIKRMSAETDIFKPTAEQKAKIIDACNTKNEVSVVLVREGNDYTLLFDDELLGKFTENFGAADNKFGMGGCEIKWNTNGNAWTKNSNRESFTYRYVYGKDKVDAYLEAVNAHLAALRRIEVAKHDDKVVLGDDGVYTLPDTVVKNGLGNTLSEKAQVISVKDGAGNTYTVNDGKVTVAYQGAIDLTITYQAGDAQVAVTVTVQRAGIVWEASATGVKLLGANGNTVTYDAEQHYGDETGAVKVVMKSDETAVFLPAYTYPQNGFVEFYAYTTDTVTVGGWWFGNTLLTPNAWTKVSLSLSRTDNGSYKNGMLAIRIMKDGNRPSIVDKTIWISSVRVHDVPTASDVTQINNIRFGNIWDGSATKTEYVEDLPTGLTDTAVKGAMKIDVTNDELAINVNGVYTKGLDAFESVYFWIYTESTGVQAGTWWCGNTDVAQGVWTKVTITRNTNWAYHNGGIHYDGAPTGPTGNPYDADNAASFIYRIMQGSGKTVYITSLYGVPKA